MCATMSVNINMKPNNNQSFLIEAVCGINSKEEEEEKNVDGGCGNGKDANLGCKFCKGSLR